MKQITGWMLHVDWYLEFFRSLLLAVVSAVSVLRVWEQASWGMGFGLSILPEVCGCQRGIREFVCPAGGQL